MQGSPHPLDHLDSPLSCARLAAFVMPTSHPSLQLRALILLMVMVVVASCLLLALSGCGTAPLQVVTCPPVPAELMQPPQPPVLLIPGSPLPRLGTTKPPTPSLAASTVPG